VPAGETLRVPGFHSWLLMFALAETPEGKGRLRATS
jgi:hypothetical protein